MPNPRLTNFNGTNSTDYLPLRQMPIAYLYSLTRLSTNAPGDDATFADVTLRARLAEICAKHVRAAIRFSFKDDLGPRLGKIENQEKTPQNYRCSPRTFSYSPGAPTPESRLLRRRSDLLMATLCRVTIPTKSPFKPATLKQALLT
jgi:hypothetical protein